MARIVWDPGRRGGAALRPGLPVVPRALGAPPAGGGLQRPGAPTTMAIDGVLACVRSCRRVRHRVRARLAVAGPRRAAASRSGRSSDAPRALGLRHAALAVDGHILAPVRLDRAGVVAARRGLADGGFGLLDGRPRAVARRGSAWRDRRLGSRGASGRRGGGPRHTGRHRPRDVRERPASRRRAAPGSDVRDRLDHEDLYRHSAGVAGPPRASVSLDDPLPELLPAGVDLPAEQQSITLAHLATHTAGLPRTPSGHGRPRHARCASCSA